MAGGRDWDDDDGFDMENLPPPDDDFDDGRDDWVEPPLTETPAERAERLKREAEQHAETEAEIRDLRDTIEDRRRHGASEKSLAFDRSRLGSLENRLDLGDPYEDDEAEPILVEPAPTAARSGARPSPFEEFKRALADELTDDERELLEAIRREEPQASIAARLGLSQGAVSKREERLRRKVNPIHRRLLGGDYSMLERSRIPGRPGRRRKP